jgi:hypothetical protein
MVASHLAIASSFHSIGLRATGNHALAQFRALARSMAAQAVHLQNRVHARKCVIALHTRVWEALMSWSQNRFRPIHLTGAASGIMRPALNGPWTRLESRDFSLLPAGPALAPALSLAIAAPCECVDGVVGSRKLTPNVVLVREHGHGETGSRLKCFAWLGPKVESREEGAEFTRYL